MGTIQHVQEMHAIQHEISMEQSTFEGSDRQLITQNQKVFQYEPPKKEKKPPQPPQHAPPVEDTARVVSDGVTPYTSSPF